MLCNDNHAELIDGDSGASLKDPTHWQEVAKQNSAEEGSSSSITPTGKYVTFDPRTLGQPITQRYVCLFRDGLRAKLYCDGANRGVQVITDNLTRRIMLYSGMRVMLDIPLNHRYLKRVYFCFALLNKNVLELEAYLNSTEGVLVEDFYLSREDNSPFEQDHYLEHDFISESSGWTSVDATPVVDNNEVEHTEPVEPIEPTHKCCAVS